MLMLLSDFFNMLAMAVFACIGGVFLGMGFLLLKLAGIFFGILAGCIILMEAAGRWISHLLPVHCRMLKWKAASCLDSAC